MIVTIGNAGREEPLTMIGPVGLRHIVEGLTRIAPELPFPIKFIELDKETPNPVQAGEFSIAYCPADHMVKCYAYRLDLRRRGRFDVKKAEKLNLPKPLWGKLQKEGRVEHEGQTYTAEQVLGDERKGISVAYCTDSRPVGRLKGFVEGAQLFICEGMYGEEEKKVKARENKHMLFSEAASLALEAGVQRLWLTHFSPSLNNPEDYLENARVIFPQTELGEERKWITIEFPKEE